MIFSAIKKYYLEFTVFICGAEIMVFELVGSRVIAPFVGTSIYVWTSLIGVILASMSLGYHFGGKLADKKTDVNYLSDIILTSGVLILFSTFAINFGSLFIYSPFSIEFKSLIISFILFGPASFFLGMVTPYAVRLKIKSIEDIGQKTGNLYAISTAGSIFGTFSAGFVIIPSIGSSLSLFLIAGVLLILAVFISVINLKRKILIVFLVFLFLISFWYLFLKVNNSKVVDVDTQYNRIFILNGESNGKEAVFLTTDPFGMQAAVFKDKNDPELVFSYTNFFHIAKYFNKDLKDTLMIGGCVYTYPRDFIRSFPNSHMDIVEIDPAMNKIAEKYFYFKPSPQLSIFNEDGRVFLNNNKKKYDAIYNDAFNSFASTPFQLTTEEAVKKEYSALNDNGIILVNIISSINGDKGKFLRAEYLTYKKVFPQVYVLQVIKGVEPENVQNIMLVALKTNKNFDFKSDDKELQGFLDNLWTEKIEADVPVLTDDYAPVDSYKRKSI